MALSSQHVAGSCSTNFSMPIYIFLGPPFYELLSQSFASDSAGSVSRFDRIDFFATRLAFCLHASLSPSLFSLLRPCPPLSLLVNPWRDGNTKGSGRYVRLKRNYPHSKLNSRLTGRIKIKSTTRRWSSETSKAKTRTKCNGTSSSIVDRGRGKEKKKKRWGIVVHLLCRLSNDRYIIIIGINLCKREM